MASRTPPVCRFLGVKRARRLETFLYSLMATQAKTPLLPRQKPLQFRGMRAMTCGALAAGDGRVDQFLIELLDHSGVAGQAEVFAA